MRRALVAAALVVAGVAFDGCIGDGTGSPEMNRDQIVRTDPTSYRNPVYPGDSPDPQAIRVGETWYLFHTNSRGQNVPVLTSPDLVTWTPAHDALPKLPSWAEPGKTWAPEVIEISAGRYVLYYTVADRASGRQCIGRAVSDTPEGPFHDDSAQPLIRQADEGGSIDASPFRDRDGSLYLLWKNDGNAVGTDTWIYVQRLAVDGLTLLGEPVRLLRQTEPWEGTLIEGPFFWRHDGTLLLFFAANAYDKDTYAEGYAICESPLGPCVKAPENPILMSNAVASGPGHASMVEQDGRTWLLYHAWPPGAEGAVEPGRQLWLSEVTWADGKPQVHGPGTGPYRRP